MTERRYVVLRPEEMEDAQRALIEELDRTADRLDRERGVLSDLTAAVEELDRALDEEFGPPLAVDRPWSLTSARLRVRYLLGKLRDREEEGESRE